MENLETQFGWFLFFEKGTDTEISKEQCKTNGEKSRKVKGTLNIHNCSDKKENGRNDAENRNNHLFHIGQSFPDVIQVSFSKRYICNCISSNYYTERGRNRKWNCIL